MQTQSFQPRSLARASVASMLRTLLVATQARRDASAGRSYNPDEYERIFMRLGLRPLTTGEHFACWQAYTSEVA